MTLYRPDGRDLALRCFIRRVSAISSQVVRHRLADREGRGQAGDFNTEPDDERDMVDGSDAENGLTAASHLTTVLTS